MSEEQKDEKPVRVPPRWVLWVAATLPFLHPVVHVLSSLMGWPCP